MSTAIQNRQAYLFGQMSALLRVMLQSAQIDDVPAPYVQKRVTDALAEYDSLLDEMRAISEAA